MRKQPKRSKGDSADPFSMVLEFVSKAYSLWMRRTFPFFSIGSNFWAHYSIDMSRTMAAHISIGNDVRVDRHVWLNIPVEPENRRPVLLLEDGCRIGRRCMISAKNLVQIGQNVQIGPSVLITDHNHAFEDLTIPIRDQGNTAGGTVRIEEGCSIGAGTAIVCSQGDLVIGRNSVIHPNSVVGRSVPPFSVLAGNPARAVNRVATPVEGISVKS